VKGELQAISTKIAGRFDSLGDNSIISHDSQSYPTNVYAKGETDVASISREGFEQCIGGRLEDISSDNDAIGLLR
jgi:hypothetical protein